MQVQELGAQGGAIRGISGGAGANCEDIVGARPARRELGLEDLGVCVRLRALSNGGSRVVYPYPSANGEFGNRAQYVGDG